MPRKRDPDRYTSTYVDRHGKERCRFRKGGFSCPLPHPSHPDYRKAYEAAVAGARPEMTRSASNSIDALIARFYRSLAFKKGGDGWQRTVRQTIEPFREEFGRDLVADFRPKDIEAILIAKMAKRQVGKREVGGLSAAARLRDQLDRLFKLAIKDGDIAANPVSTASELPTAQSDGFHSWTEEEIAIYQNCYTLGTKARLALEILLWTGLRRGDAIRLGPQHLRDWRIRMQAGKTGKAVDLIAAPDLLAAIEAMPAVGLTTFLVTEYGRPFTVAGFGGWFRDRCNATGLPHCTAHGLRKALARRAADLGATQQQLKAVGQWSSDRDVATYTAASEQRGLADAALSKVIEWAGTDGDDCLTSEKPIV